MYTYSYNASAHPKVPIYDVEQKGFDSENGDLLNSDVYSTACSCSNIIHSFASEAPRSVRDRDPVYVYL